MSERFISFTVEQLLFCYDMDKKCLMIDDKNAKYRKVGYGSLSFFIRTRYNM